MRQATTQTGTQSIERAILLLKEIIARNRVGWRLRDLSSRCELRPATAHRILDCLVRERLVIRRSDDRHYLPGPLLFEMGLALPGYARLQAATRPALVRIARRFGGLALLSLRSGNEFVCIGREGEALYRGALDEIGTRRPLMCTASGAAILAALPKDEAAAVIVQNRRQLAGLEAASLRALDRMVRRAATTGYAFNQGVTARGIHAFSMALRDRRRVPFGSLTIAANASLLPADGTDAVLAMLTAEAALIERHAAAALPDLAATPVAASRVSAKGTRRPLA